MSPKIYYLLLPAMNYLTVVMKQTTHDKCFSKPIQFLLNEIKLLWYSTLLLGSVYQVSSVAYAATRLKSNKGGVKNHKMKMQDNCSSYRFRIRD